ncbi:peptide/nickel transport system permease protein [Faunimonas pinastri]|uniref:Peptide/nickel transport system permease protein n=1 Tax=Faunimonas pinastri TaxID=1855383 RepID=A0A1H9K537_9HYPH|nr:ABC transporter permease [Faunimonas pinastri]SEQ94222.1 peptide/nickel transport system permease protein [Faunimonas pinastri]
MLYFLMRRLVSAIGLIFVVSIVSFLLIQAPPGDYATTLKADAMSRGGMSETEAEAMAQAARVRLGLDRPLPVQYLHWIGGIVGHGDFGPSFRQNKPAAQVIGQRIWWTLGIAIVCHLLATVIGAGLGIFAAVNQHRLGDSIATTFAFLGMTIPRFFMALVILYLLAFVIHSPNIGSLFSADYVFAPWSLGRLGNLFLHVWPIILIASFGGLAYNLRVMRGNLLDVLRQPFIEAARAKGLPERKVILKHAVPNAIHPLVMYQGVIMPYMISGELETAIVLSVPTIGPLMFQSLISQDIYVTATIFLFLSVLLVVGNLLADLALALIDPRIRQGAHP